jgi:enoyl-CoA hydratase/carnithine racemase
MIRAESSLSLSIDEPIAVLTIDRVAKYNALSEEVWERFPILVGDACAAPGTRVIIVRGAARNFAAGADIDEFDRVFADRAAALRYLEAMIAATDAIAAAPVPVIAAIEGLCIGAGVAVALACDLRIADAAASFAVTPAKLGLLYSLTDTRRLVAAVGSSRAKDLLFTGARIDAAQALSIGLIDVIGGQQDVAAKAAAIAAQSPWTHAHTKSILRAIESGRTTETDETRSWFADASQTNDFKEGLAAFQDRRRPEFPTRR